MDQAAAAMERDAGGRTASALFAGFRALGLFSNDIPHVVRFNALKRRFYVTTCVGKSFHTYDVSDFFHRQLSGNHPPGPPGLAWGPPPRAIPVPPPAHLGLSARLFLNPFLLLFTIASPPMLG